MTRAMSHRGFSAFAASRGIAFEVERTDGAAVLVCDDRLRVHVHPAPQGALALEARIAPMPGDARQADEVLDRAMAMSAGRLADLPESLVLSQDERELRLQWPVAAEAGEAEFASALEAFLNALGEWRMTLGQL